MKAMILAAGLGTRMRPLTEHTPKPLLVAGGKPLIVYHLEKLKAAGFEHVVINTAWLGEKIEQALGDGDAFGLKLEYSREGQPLETAGGIARAMPLLDAQNTNTPFLVVNGDIYTDYDFSALYQHFSSTGLGDKLAHLVLVPNPAHHPQGDFCLDPGSPDKSRASVYVQEDEKQSPKRYTFSGIGVYSPELFEPLKNSVLDENEYKLAPLLRSAMHAQQVTGELFEGQWWDIGTPQRLQQLDDFLTQARG